MNDQQAGNTAQETAAAETAQPKKKKTFWQGFMNFIMMGGFMVILILGVVIAIVLSSVFQCK